MNQELTTRFLPALTLSSETSFIANTGSYIRENSEDRGIGASFTRIIGSHTLKEGGDIRIGPYNYIRKLAGGTGTFAFDKTLTSSNPTSPAGGYDFATFMLGYPTSGSIPTANRVSAEQIYRAVYVQDDWRATRKLTFNLGLRYEQPGPWSERYNRLSDFMPNAVSPLAAKTGLPLMGAFTLVDTPAHPGRNNMLNMSKLLFGPRAGLAYQLTPKTVLRMGYGLFYLPNNSVPGADPHSDLVNTATTSTIRRQHQRRDHARQPDQQSFSKRFNSASRTIQSQLRIGSVGHGPGLHHRQYSYRKCATVECQYSTGIADGPVSGRRVCGIEGHASAAFLRTTRSASGSISVPRFGAGEAGAESLSGPGEPGLVDRSHHPLRATVAALPAVQRLDGCGIFRWRLHLPFASGQDAGTAA